MTTTDKLRFGFSITARELMELELPKTVATTTERGWRLFGSTYYTSKPDKETTDFDHLPRRAKP
jgi:hypothetical protein